jgi:hypothetical protein
MKKSAIRQMPAHFDRYINLVEDVDIMEALEQGSRQLEEINVRELQAVGSSVYAPDKWTVNDIFQHLIDSERIFAYRALRFARNDRMPLQPFDQDLFATQAAANSRELAGLLDEFRAVRQSTLFLFRSFDDAMLQKTGMSGDVQLSVLALGFTIAGHQIHHLQILRDKYVPLGHTEETRPPGNE